jgi:hypothetical protein
MLLTSWQKNTKVERTSPGSKNKYKVTYWDGQEKWTSDYPGDGRGDRREKRLQERKQSRPSIKDAKEKLDAAVKKYEGGGDLSGAASVVDSVVVLLGREGARQTIRGWVKEKSSMTGKGKEMVDAIQQKSVDKLRDKKARLENIAKRVVMRMAGIEKKGWMDTHGKFYPLRGGENHEDFARRQLNWKKEGWASDLLWWQGWFRIVSSTMSEKALVAQSNDGKILNDVQRRELAEMAIVLGFPKVMMENEHGFRVVWENENQMVAGDRLSMIAGKVAQNVLEKTGEKF